MAHYSVATTRDNLSSLINKALAGEEVVITRHGKPAVALRIVEPTGSSKADIAEAMEELRIGRESRPSSPISSAELMREVRNEYRY